MKKDRVILEGRLDNCKKGKHKLRENRFGVTWCVVCGLLSNKPAEELLKEEDKEIYTGYENNIHAKNS
jgi:hypothetical protein